MVVQQQNESGQAVRHRAWMSPCLFVAALGLSGLSFFLGPADISPVDLLIGLFDGHGVAGVIAREIRFPRAALALVVGAALGASGAALQGLFRNPLADPAIVGVSAGASLGAVSVIVLGATVLAPAMALFGIFTLPLAAFGGALAVTLVLYRISTRRGQTSVATMLLAGIAVGAMAMAFTGFLIFVADDRQLRELTFWTLGSLAGSTWTKLWAAGPIILAAFAISPFLARG
ncbi:MAG TPA: iron chelate uptake ABC transporter family permease subunit, partial [Rhizomicrobium sp.]|nr:iron chelate uptake ABC transporter family permease subunit [Rhizomicrobium sp.]